MKIIDYKELIKPEKKEDFIKWLLDNGITECLDLPFLPAIKDSFEYENKNIFISLFIEKDFCFIHYKYLLTGTEKLKHFNSYNEAKQFLKLLIKEEK